MPWVWVWCLKLTLPLLSTSATGYCRESASSLTQTEHWVLQGVCLILNTDWTLGTAGSPHLHVHIPELLLLPVKGWAPSERCKSFSDCSTCSAHSYDMRHKWICVTATECLRVIKHKTAVLHITDHEQYSTDDIFSEPLNLDERQLTSSFDLKKKKVFSLSSVTQNTVFAVFAHYYNTVCQIKFKIPNFSLSFTFKCILITCWDCTTYCKLWLDICFHPKLL